MNSQRYSQHSLAVPKCTEDPDPIIGKVSTALSLILKRQLERSIKPITQIQIATIVIANPAITQFFNQVLRNHSMQKLSGHISYLDDFVSHNDPARW